MMTRTPSESNANVEARSMSGMVKRDDNDAETRADDVADDGDDVVEVDFDDDDGVKDSATSAPETMRDTDVFRRGG